MKYLIIHSLAFLTFHTLALTVFNTELRFMHSAAVGFHLANLAIALIDLHFDNKLKKNA